MPLHLFQDGNPMTQPLHRLLLASLALSLLAPAARAAEPTDARADNTPPPGFVALFNGKDLSGWKGLPRAPLDNPFKRKSPTEDDLKKAGAKDLADAQAQADKRMRDHWKV